MDIQLDTLSLSSDPISKLSATSCLLPDDLFIIDKAHAGNQPYHSSEKLSYKNLSSQVYDDVVKRLDLSTMAFRDTWEYSKANHEHEYSKVNVFPIITYDDVIKQYGDEAPECQPHELSEWLGTFAVDQMSSVQIGVTPMGKPIMTDRRVQVSADIFMPHVKKATYTQPQIGEMRLTGWRHWPQDTRWLKTEVFNDVSILYDVSNNGYWAFPNGNRITCTSKQFVEACKVYGNNDKSGSDTSFTLPKVDKFIVPFKPGTQFAGKNLSSLLDVPYQVGVPQHQHDVDVDQVNERFSSTDGILIKVPATFCMTTQGGQESYIGKYIHSGGDSNKIADKKNLPCAQCTYIAAEVNSWNIAAQECEADPVSIQHGTEQHPAYIDIPAIVYIGRK